MRFSPGPIFDASAVHVPPTSHSNGAIAFVAGGFAAAWPWTVGGTARSRPSAVMSELRPARRNVDELVRRDVPATLDVICFSLRICGMLRGARVSAVERPP